MQEEKLVELVIGEDVEDVPQVLRKIRQMQKLSQDDVFVRTGITQHLLSMYENSKRKISDRKLQALIDGLDAKLVVRFKVEEENKEVEEIIKIKTMKELFEYVAGEENNRNVVMELDMTPEDEDTQIDSNDTSVLIKQEIDKLRYIKNVNLDEVKITLYDENNNMFDYLNDENMISIGTAFDNLDEIKSYMRVTKMYLERTLELEEEIERNESIMKQMYNVGDVSYRWISSFKNYVLLAISVKTECGLKELKWMKYGSLMDQEDFIKSVVDTVKRKCFVDSQVFKDADELIKSLKETIQIAHKYIKCKSKLSALSYEKEGCCFSSLENYLFYISTNTVDVNFWYYDGSDSGYDPVNGGGSIGCEIRFLDDLNSYCYSEIVMRNIYENNKFENLTFEYLCEFGLKKLNELLNGEKQLEE